MLGTVRGRRYPTSGKAVRVVEIDHDRYWSSGAFMWVA